MAAVIKKPNRPFYYAVFRAPDADGRMRQIWRSTESRDRKVAMEIANQLERAEKLAAQGMLTKSRALELLDEVLRRIEPDETLLADSVEDFLNKWQDSKKTEGMADSSLARYKGVAESFLRSLGPKGKRPITALTKQDVEKWRKGLLAEGRAATTVNWSVKVLSSALEGAVRSGDIRMNPTKDVKRIKTAKADVRKRFTPEQVRALLKEANNEWRGMILFAYHCGLRLSDAANLTWEAIDLAEGTVAFQPQKTAGTPDSAVTVVMHPDLVKYLEALPTGDDPKQALFPSLKGRSVGSSAGLSNEFGRMIGKAGIRQVYGSEKTGRGRQLSLLSFHSLRHAFVSKAHVAAEGKVSAEVLKGMAGHSTDEAHRRYVHLQTKDQKAVVAAFESVL